MADSLQCADPKAHTYHGWDEQCEREHPPLEGPNMDIGQCWNCGMPIGVMRPKGQSFGWHIDDCSLHVNHAGACVGGGAGHEIPEGEVIRG